MAPTSVKIPVSGEIKKTDVTAKVLSAAIAKKPLESLSLALEDWGQSPWRLQRILSEAALLFERNSYDKDKKQIAEDTKKNVTERIATLKSHYEEVVRAGGTDDDVARKLADDISFMESMFSFIQAQVNGLVSIQKSWKARSDAINSYYSAKIELGWWEKAKKRVPWLNNAVGAGAGVALWAFNGWEAIVLAIQAGVRQIPGIRDMDPKITDDIVKLLVNIGGIVGLTYATSWLDSRFLKRKAALEEACSAKQKGIMDEEKRTRRDFLSLIKEKAVELNAKYGYLLELEKEDTEMYNFTKENDFESINAVHRARVKRILGADVPDHLINAAESDTNSTDIITAKVTVPPDAKG